MSIFDRFRKKPKAAASSEGAVSPPSAAQEGPQDISEVKLPDERYRVAPQGFERAVKQAQGLEPKPTAAQTEGTTRATFVPDSDKQWVNKTEGGSRG